MAAALRIAYLGIPGSFSYSAALDFFGPDHHFCNFPDFRRIFAAVSSGDCAHALVPLENSLAGSIYENYDLLRSSSLSITGEVLLKVEHHLCIVQTGDSPAEAIARLTHLYSHPKALEQVSRFLSEHPHIKAVATSDTATAAQYVQEMKDPRHAAVCSRNAAAIHHLHIIQQHLEDDPQNYTRFAVISGKQSADSEDNKCSLLLTLPHIPKSLFKTLEIIVSAALNTSKIESRPIPDKPFEYVFYLDFDFEPHDRAAVDQMLERLKESVPEFKILGFYRRSKVFS